MRRRPSKYKARTFRGMPVVEAKASIHVQPNAKDISGATPESPDNCAYARCLRRTFDASSVFVFKTVAYVQTLNTQGQPILERFIVRKYAREYIVKFDHGEKVEPGGFVFHAPSRGLTLAWKLKKDQRYGRSPHREKGKKPELREFSLRRGTGRCHFYGPDDQIKIPR